MGQSRSHHDIAKVFRMRQETKKTFLAQTTCGNQNYLWHSWVPEVILVPTCWLCQHQTAWQESVPKKSHFSAVVLATGLVHLGPKWCWVVQTPLPCADFFFQKLLHQENWCTLSNRNHHLGTEVKTDTESMSVVTRFPDVGSAETKLNKSFLFCLWVCEWCPGQHVGTKITSSTDQCQR